MTGINSHGERIHGKLIVDSVKIKGQAGDTYFVNGQTFHHYGDRLWGFSGWHPAK